ncbi:hypothetical protein PG991_010241 [Apiospora marii]|uniref:Heterokaryon incompatibility domain-containing protein n=1 Tax=Apiospora marii TaxID=335849 RepID=A0ABR1RHX8_9PEZI
MEETSPLEWISHLRLLSRANTADTTTPRNWALLLQDIDELRELGVLPYLLLDELRDNFDRLELAREQCIANGDLLDGIVVPISYWLHTCLSSHLVCHRHLEAWPELPRRVIDLAGFGFSLPPVSQRNDLRILDGREKRGAYAALSYRWPIGLQGYKILSRSSEAKLSESFSVEDVFPVIRDACVLTSRLGIRYLWVDSLCIMQGHKGDWHIEADKMDMVYSNAIFTIASIDGTRLVDSCHRRPFLQKPPKNPKQEKDISLSEMFGKARRGSEPTTISNPENIWGRLLKTNNFPSRPNGELDERGWTFQEKLLSQRIVNITKDGVFWDCLERSACDRRPLGLLGDFSPGFRDNDDRAWKRLLLSKLTSEGITPPTSWYWLWRRAVQDYTQRSLTNMGDRMIALNGIARRFASHGRDEYILGLWKNDLLRSLIWFVELGTDEKHSNASHNKNTQGNPIIAPSWSWVSVPYPVKYRLWHPFEYFIEKKHELTKYLARCYSTMLVKYENYSFDVFFGRLTLNGPTTKALLFDGTIFVRRDDTILRQDNTAAESQKDPAHMCEPSSWDTSQNDPIGIEPRGHTPRESYSNAFAGPIPKPGPVSLLHRLSETKSESKFLQIESTTPSASRPHPSREMSIDEYMFGLVRKRPKSSKPRLETRPTAASHMPGSDIRSGTVSMTEDLKASDNKGKSVVRTAHHEEQLEAEIEVQENGPKPLESINAGDLRLDQRKTHHEREFAETPFLYDRAKDANRRGLQVQMVTLFALLEAGYLPNLQARYYLVLRQAAPPIEQWMGHTDSGSNTAGHKDHINYQRIGICVFNVQDDIPVPEESETVNILQYLLHRSTLYAQGVPGADVSMAKPIRCAPELQDLTIWHRYEPQLRELYIVQNQTLRQVKESMETQHNWPVFKLATYELVLRDELRLVKNLTKDDWHAIQHHIEKRKRISKRSEVFIYGQLLDQKRITKAMSRYRHSVEIGRAKPARTPVLRDSVRIHTPPLLSPRTLVPGGMAYAQTVTMAEASNSTTNEASPILPVSSRGPLSIQAILDIRSNAPFNQFAKRLQELGQSFIRPAQRRASSIAHSQQLVMDSVSSRRLPQPDPTTANHQALNTLERSFRNNTGQLNGLLETDEDLGVLPKACYVFSNNLNDFEVQRRFLEWVGLVAEMQLLRAFFSLKLPTVIAVWENSLDATYRFQDGKAFAILIEIGLAVDNGRLIRSRHATYFAMAIDLGSSDAMGTASRLMKAGVSPNSRFDRFCLSLIPEKRNHGDWIDHYWRCCALKQAAKNRDSEMLELLIAAGNCRCGKFDAMYGNILLRTVATRDPTTGRTPSLQCVNVITDAGMRVDFLPEASETTEFTTRSLGWPSCGKPELLVDRVFFSVGAADRDVYEAVASKSQWAQKSVTVSGIFLAAEAGTAQIKRYLVSAAIPQSTAKDALLQIALSEAADRDDLPVLVCLLQYGVDPNVNTLVAGLPEDERPLWSPIVRASTRWNIGALRLLLAHGADVGRYPLFRRAMQKTVKPGSDYSHLEKRRSLTVQSLLDAEAHIDIPAASLTLAALVPLRPYYPEGVNVFMNAHIRQWLDHIKGFKPDYALCDKLHQHGISFDRGVDGCNTLQTVLREGCNRSTVSYLIESGVQVHSFLSERFAQHFGDTTMLHDALLMAHVDRVEIVDLLLENGADIYATTSKGLSVLEASLMMPNLNIPYHMQRSKDNQQGSMDIFWKLVQRMGPLQASVVEFKRQSLLSYLIELEESDDSICAGLDTIADINNYGVLQGQGAKVNEPPARYGRTALQSAASLGNLGAVTMLLEHGADVNAKPGAQFCCILRSSEKLTHRHRAVDMAASLGHLDMVHLLVGAGGLSGNPGVTGLDGAIIAADKNGHNSIVEYLERHTGYLLSEVMYQAKTVPKSLASSDASTSSAGSERTDGERSCHCQPAAIDRETDGTGEEGYSPVEDIPDVHGAATTSRNLSMPLRFPVYTCTFTSPDSPRPETLHKQIVAPGAATIAVPDAKYSSQAGNGGDTNTDFPTERASGDPHPEDSMSRIAAGDVNTHELRQFPESFDQLKANNREWESYSEDDGVNRGECLSPMTRGILDWIEEIELDCIPNPWNLDLFKFPSQPSDDCLFNLARVRYWLDGCTSIHSRCGYYGDTVLPTRVLDVGPGTDSSIFLRESKGLCGRYICLSYCWGNSTFTKTTRDNIESHKQGIILESLPQTFQDTIHVARALNVRFLWIDALCIIQQDVDCADWKRECGNMANIYRNAYLTISATWANSPTLGLFPKPNWFRLEPIVVRVIHHLPKTPTPEESVHFPVLGRGGRTRSACWQHGYFTLVPPEMIWDCMSTHACECATADDEYYNASKSIFSQAMSNPTDTGPHSLHTVWRRMVEQYTPLQLTSPTDRLPAFSGLANEMQQGKDLEYLAGLWRDTLVSDMCWAVAMPEDQKPSPQAPRRLPTWSWTSVDAPVQYYEHIRTGSPRTQLAEVLDARCILEGPSATGPVKEGFIELECSLIPAFFEDGLLRTASFDFKRADFDAAYGDQPSGEYYVIPLCLEEQIPDFYPDPDPMICGIIVTQKNSQEMTRVGAFKQHSKELIGFEKQKVRIV